MVIRALSPADAPAFLALRLRCFSEETSFFGSSYEESCQVPLGEAEALLGRRGRSPDDFVLGAFSDVSVDPALPLALWAGQGPPLQGIVGLTREPRRKRAHRALVWGMYVVPEAREKFVGRALMEALIARARCLAGLERLNLVVMAHNDRAIGLYEGLGFRLWGREGRALRLEGAYYDELSMGLELHA